MDISREELTTRFRDLSDEDLLSRVRVGALTPLAFEVASIELQSRGIALPVEARDDDGELNNAVDAETELVTVATFWDPIQANLVRGLLETAGIFVHMWGEHLGVAHTFLSVAAGGMKLQVLPGQAAQAKDILKAFERGDFAMKDEPE